MKESGTPSSYRRHRGCQFHLPRPAPACVPSKHHKPSQGVSLSANLVDLPRKSGCLIQMGCGTVLVPYDQWPSPLVGKQLTLTMRPRQTRCGLQDSNNGYAKNVSVLLQGRRRNRALRIHYRPQPPCAGAPSTLADRAHRADRASDDARKRLELGEATSRTSSRFGNPSLVPRRRPVWAPKRHHATDGIANTKPNPNWLDHPSNPLRFQRFNRQRLLNLSHPA